MFRLENENIISRWDGNAHQASHTGKKQLLKRVGIGYKYNAIILLKTLARGVFSKDRNQIGWNYFSEISPPLPLPPMLTPTIPNTHTHTTKWKKFNILNQSIPDKYLSLNTCSLLRERKHAELGAGILLLLPHVWPWRSPTWTFFLTYILQSLPI